MSYPTIKCAIGTKRGSNYGLVYSPEGVVIGRVMRDAKVARAGLGGGRRSFWTAYPILDGERAMVSLGTRHVHRRDATAALLAFYASYPPETIKRAALVAAPFPSLGNDWRDCLRRALSCAAADFKRDQWKLCGLSVCNQRDRRFDRFHIHVQPVR